MKEIFGSVAIAVSAAVAWWLWSAGVIFAILGATLALTGCLLILGLIAFFFDPTQGKHGLFSLADQPDPPGQGNNRRAP